ncbi:MAG TPA: DUF1707 domain-containing protein [Streptosporangiaceae bacterium]|nr:DUF1707 domain-containing protein [Streptosporangiaceae bacterium]
MSAPSSAPPTKDGAPRARANYANPGMRISDAERSEVADRLSAHYGDGRLDQEEFSRRMDQAMNAKTQADLNGLFADLPDGDVPAAGTGLRPGGRGPAAGSGARRGGPGRVIAIILIAIVAAFAVHALGWLVPWVLVAALAYVWLRHRRRPERQAPPQAHQQP